MNKPLQVNLHEKHSAKVCRSGLVTIITRIQHLQSDVESGDTEVLSKDVLPSK